MYLQEKLRPILDYFNVSVIIPNNTLLNEESWFKVPPYSKNVFDYFVCHIIPLLRRCISQSVDSNDIQYTLSSNFTVVNDNDFNQIVKLITEKSGECYLLVNENINRNGDNVLVTISDRIIEIPLLRDVFKDELVSLSTQTKIDFSNKDVPFPNKDLCLYFAEKSGKNSTVADFKYYSHFILLRNGYDKISYKSDNYKNTSSYKRRDGKFLVSLDCRHNTFEVFHCDKQKEFYGEYTTTGNPVESKTSDPNKHKYKK